MVSLAFGDVVSINGLTTGVGEAVMWAEDWAWAWEPTRLDAWVDDAAGAGVVGPVVVPLYPKHWGW
jgi:hypothetical protein